MLMRYYEPWDSADTDDNHGEEYYCSDDEQEEQHDVVESLPPDEDDGDDSYILFDGHWSAANNHNGMAWCMDYLTQHYHPLRDIFSNEEGVLEALDSMVRAGSSNRDVATENHNQNITTESALSQNNEDDDIDRRVQDSLAEGGERARQELDRAAVGNGDRVLSQNNEDDSSHGSGNTFHHGLLFPFQNLSEGEQGVLAEFHRRRQVGMDNRGRELAAFFRTRQVGNDDSSMSDDDDDDDDDDKYAGMPDLIFSSPDDNDDDDDDDDYADLPELVPIAREIRGDSFDSTVQRIQNIPWSSRVGSILDLTMPPPRKHFSIEERHSPRYGACDFYGTDTTSYDDDDDDEVPLLVEVPPESQSLTQRPFSFTE